MRKEDSHPFTRLESQNKKESNMLSALIYFGTVERKLREPGILRLISDSC